MLIRVKILQNNNHITTILSENKFKENKLEFKHKPVMLEEVLEGLNIKENGIYLDGTLRRSWA